MPRRKHGPSPPTASPAVGLQPQQPVGPAKAEGGHEVPAEAVPPRRRFIRRLWALASAAGLVELAWVTASFLRPRELEGSAKDLFVAGPADRFEPGSVTAFPAGRFYLVRMKEGGFLALHRECTHLGCTVPWDAAQGRFACPCHASAFDLTGVVLSPPAPRPLDFYAVRIENSVVKVDTRRRLQRTAFDPSQVTVA